MRKYIYTLLFCIVVIMSSTVYSQEKVADFEKDSLPVLNDELGRMLGDVDDNTASTEANTTAIASLNSLPQGGIIIWSGAISAIPTGWELCDGSCTITCPNLTDRFVIHADADSGGTNDVGDTGGAHSVTLTDAQSALPAHTHTVDADTAGGATLGIPDSRDSALNEDINSGSTSQANAVESHENRPKFYALAYIIKI